MVQKTQGGPVESLMYQCYCGEDSFFNLYHFDWNDERVDDDYYVSITIRPTSWRGRLGLAWKALRGLETTVSNEVLLSKEQINDFSNELREYLAPKALRSDAPGSYPGE